MKVIGAVAVAVVALAAWRWMAWIDGSILFKEVARILLHDVLTPLWLHDAARVAFGLSLVMVVSLVTVALFGKDR